MKCCLTNHGHRTVSIIGKIRHFISGLQDMGRAYTPVPDPVDFGMIGITDDQDHVPCLGPLTYDLMDILYKRTGRIHDPVTGRFQCLNFRTTHTMRTDDHHGGREFLTFRKVIDALHTLPFQISRHFLIMYDRAIGIDLTSVLFCRFGIGHIHSPFHTETEACFFCKDHFHNLLLLFLLSVRITYAPWRAGRSHLPPGRWSSRKNPPAPHPRPDAAERSPGSYPDNLSFRYPI